MQGATIIISTKFLGPIGSAETIEEITLLFVISSNLEIYFFDVGQADSIFLNNNGYTMLIDAGNNDDGNKVVKYLKDNGVKKLDYLIGTHPHEDHIGGLDNVINAFEIETILK